MDNDKLDELERVAQKLADHFGFREFEDMALDRATLRSLIADGYDINEPTQDDCREAAKDVLALITAARRPEALEEVCWECDFGVGRVCPAHTKPEARRPALPDREAVELILRDTLTVGHGSTDGFAVTFVDGIQEAVEYICALSPAQAERDDMVLVPREPTEAMLNASWLTTAAATPDERMAMELCDSKAAFKLKLARRYRAMLSAAPKEEPDHG